MDVLEIHLFCRILNARLHQVANYHLVSEILLQNGPKFLFLKQVLVIL